MSKPQLNLWNARPGLDSFNAGTWQVFADDLIGDFAGAETFLAYMKPSAEAGYNWKSDAYEAKMNEAAEKADQGERNVLLAEAEKILLDDYLFAPICIVPSRRLIKTNIKGWDDSAAGYNNTQFLSFE